MKKIIFFILWIFLLWVQQVNAWLLPWLHNFPDWIVFDYYSDDCVTLSQNSTIIISECQSFLNWQEILWMQLVYRSNWTLRYLQLNTWLNSYKLRDWSDNTETPFTSIQWLPWEFINHDWFKISLDASNSFNWTWDNPPWSITLTNSFLFWDTVYPLSWNDSWPSLWFCTLLPEVSDGMQLLHPTQENAATWSTIKTFNNWIFIDYQVNTINYTLALWRAENITNFTSQTLWDSSSSFTFDSLDSPFEDNPHILIYNNDSSQVWYDISWFWIIWSWTPFNVYDSDTWYHLNDWQPLPYNQSLILPPGIKEISIEFEKSSTITNTITDIIYASKVPVQSLHEYCVADDNLIYRDWELHYITDNWVTRPATNDDFNITQDQDGKAYYDWELVPFNSSDWQTITPLNGWNIYNDEPLRKVLWDNYVVEPEIKTDFERFSWNITWSWVLDITEWIINSPIWEEGQLCEMFNDAWDFIYSSNWKIFANLSLEKLWVPESVSSIWDIALKPINSILNSILTVWSIFTPVTQNTNWKTYCLLWIIVKYQARPIMQGHELQYKMFILDYVFLFLYYMFLFKTFYYIRHNTLISIEN